MKLEEWANEMPRLDKAKTASKEAVEGVQAAVERGRGLDPLPEEKALRLRLATFAGDYGAWSPNSGIVVHLTAILRDWFYDEEESGDEGVLDLAEARTGDLIEELIARLPGHEGHLGHVRDQLGEDEWFGKGESGA